jgi:hypothetical protein
MDEVRIDGFGSAATPAPVDISVVGGCCVGDDERPEPKVARHSRGCRHAVRRREADTDERVDASLAKERFKVRPDERTVFMLLYDGLTRARRRLVFDRTARPCRMEWRRGVTRVVLNVDDGSIAPPPCVEQCSDSRFGLRVVSTTKLRVIMALLNVDDEERGSLRESGDHEPYREAANRLATSNSGRFPSAPAMRAR